MSPRWLGLVPGAALLGALAGRYAHPRVVTRDVVQVQTRDVVKTQVVHDVQTVHDVATQVRTVTVTKWATAPDGSRTIVQESHAEQDRQSEAKAQARTTVDRVAELQQQVTELHTVTPATRPDWSATALVGGQLGGRSLLVPAPYVVGVVLERRILGPVSAGLWATSAMAGGLSVRVDF